MKHFGEKKPLMKQFGAQTSFDETFRGEEAFDETVRGTNSAIPTRTLVLLPFLRLHAIVALYFGALVLEVPWRVLFLEMH